MRPLTLDDVLPLGDFASQRRDFFAAHCRYLDHYRKVRIGPKLTLQFENRQTLWFRVQDLLRIARLAEPERVQLELDLYNRLLPRRDRLQAALFIAISDEGRLNEEMAFWRLLGNGETLQLKIGERSIPCRLVTTRAEDRCIGTAHWVQFMLTTVERTLLADNRERAYFAVSDAAYAHQSPPLSDDVRQSLVEDLELSDRD